MPTIAITGASGFLGTELTNYFADKGWTVVGLVRKPEAQPAKKNVHYREYSLTEPLTKDLLKGVDYLAHTAYVKQDKTHPGAFNSNIKAAEQLVKSARKHGLKKMLFMSSMSAHDEAISSYGKQKLAIEKIFNGKDCVSIRAGLIIGNGGIVKQMAAFMRSKHAVPLIGGGKQPLQIVAVSDLVKTIEILLTKPLFGVYTVATPEIYSYKSFYKALAAAISVRIIYVPIPFFALLGVIQLITLLRIPLGVNKDNALGLKQLRSADTAPDLKKIGVSLTPLDTALQKSNL